MWLKHSVFQPFYLNQSGGFARFNAPKLILKSQGFGTVQGCPAEYGFKGNITLESRNGLQASRMDNCQLEVRPSAPTVTRAAVSMKA
jgi:predicted metal-binding protein